MLEAEECWGDRALEVGVLAVEECWWRRCVGGVVLLGVVQHRREWWRGIARKLGASVVGVVFRSYKSTYS